MANNKINFGLHNVYVAFQTESGYSTPVAIPGAVSLSTNAEGNQNVFYADNIPYVTFSSNAGYTGDLEMALLPDSVLAEMLGWEIDDNGALVENAQGVAKPFALLFEVKGDDHNRRNVFYSCTASRPTSTAQTSTETTDPQTQTLNVTMIPKRFTFGSGATATTRDITKASIERTAENAQEYDSFFSAVYTPEFS